ncbi:MAG: metalloregulator ArsR/SmtB family transcription factor [Candidatus Thermoplasmatota archaeon]
MDSGSLLRLISESTRYNLLARLRSGEQTVGQLVAALDDEQSNLSHHLATLRKAGLVAARKIGRTQRYRLSDAEVGHLLDQVDALTARLDHVGASAALGMPAGPAFPSDGL